MTNSEHRDQEASGTNSQQYWIQWGIMCFFSIFQFLLQGSVGVLAEGMKLSFQVDAAGVGILSSSFL